MGRGGIAVRFENQIRVSIVNGTDLKLRCGRLDKHGTPWFPNSPCPHSTMQTLRERYFV